MNHFQSEVPCPPARSLLAFPGDRFLTGTCRVFLAWLAQSYSETPAAQPQQHCGPLLCHRYGLCEPFLPHQRLQREGICKHTRMSRENVTSKARNLTPKSPETNHSVWVWLRTVMPSPVSDLQHFILFSPAPLQCFLSSLPAN